MSEPIYEFVKGQGWVLSTRSDPHTLWVSPDGKYAIAKVCDVPDGTPRTISYSLTRTLPACIQILENDTRLIANETYHKGSLDVAKYVRTTLPWESA